MQVILSPVIEGVKFNTHRVIMFDFVTNGNGDSK